MARPTAKSPHRRTRALGLALVIVVCLYVGLLPILSQVAENTRNLEKETEQRLAAARAKSELKTELDTLREAAEATPRDIRAGLEYAAKLQQLGQSDRAAPFAEAAVEANPKDADALYLLADIYTRARRYEKAVPTWKRLLSVAPLDERGLAGLGWLYISFGWTIEARDLLAAAVKSVPNSLSLKVAHALACVQHSDYKRAEDLLLGVRAAAPDQPDLWMPLADLYLRMQKHRDAVRVAQDVLKLNPNDTRVRSIAAQSLYSLNNLAEAEENLNIILHADPENVPARYRLAVIYKRTDRSDQSRNGLEWVLARAPGYEQTRLLLGQAYVAAGRRGEGRKLLAEYKDAQLAGQKRERVNLILSMKPNSAEAHIRMAEVCRDEGNLSRAIVELVRATELEPKNSEAARLLSDAKAALVQASR